MTSIGASIFSGCDNLTSIVVEEDNPVYDSRGNCNAIIRTATNKLIRGCQSTIIPNSVTSIGRTAFNGCTRLTSITIPNGVTSIEDNAFNGCTNLTSITISNSVTSIEQAAFSNTNLPIENSIRYAGTWAIDVTDKTKAKYTLRDNTTGIADYAFFSCSNLTSITIPDGVTSIGSSTFYGCSSLTSITIPDGVTSIGSFTFYGCTGLTSITIPDGVTSIGQDAFSNTNLPIENNIRYADTWAVEVTNSESSTYTLRDNTTGIADYMFQQYNNNSMTGITLPNGLKHIGKYAFQGCFGLTSLIIPNSVKSIGECAFMNCWGVTSVTIPSSVTSIGERAFTGGGNRISVVVDAGNTVYDSRGNCNAIICTETNHLIAGCSTTIIPNNVTSIGGCAFMNCGITSASIPNGVTCIKDQAFAGSALTSIVIPSSVTSIERYAFAYCNSLTTITCRNAVPPTCETDAFQNVNTAICVLEVPLNSVSIYRETSPWSGFNISAIIPQTLVLNDGEVFENEKNMIVDQITYTRTLNNLEWNALYVPFEIPVSQLIDDYEVAYINGIHSYDDDDNGEIDRMSMEVVKVKSGTLHANHPYLIKARTEAAKQMNITVNNTTLYAAESTTLDCSSVYTKSEITGIYEKMTGSELAGCYALSGGTWKTIASNSYLNPFRLYLRITSRGNSPIKVSPLAMTRINIHVKGEDSSTSVEEMMMQEQLPNDEIIYDLMGRRVENPVKRHIYIVNGMKRVY